MAKIKYVYPTDEYGEYDLGLINQAYDLGKKSGIHVMSDREPSWMAMSGRKVIGAIFISFIGKDFTFDTVVDRAHQGKRIGSHLVDLGIQEYNNLASDMPEIELILDVVNPTARRILERKGFIVLEKIAGDRVIMGLKQS